MRLMVVSSQARPRTEECPSCVLLALVGGGGLREGGQRQRRGGVQLRGPYQMKSHSLDQQILSDLASLHLEGLQDRD